jgi:DNA-binding NarL/FixJ family response regulator
MNILIAEDDPLLRTLLGELLAAEPDFEVCGSVASGQECLEFVVSAPPDLLLLDLNLPGISGRRVLEQLGARAESPAVLVLSGEDGEDTQVEAAGNGARGFLAKSEALSCLPAAIRAVGRGETWFSGSVARRIFREYQQLVRRVRTERRPVGRLTDREREVLILMARGRTNIQIADDLVMSIHTVKLHVQNILRKLELPNRTEAAVFAVREGLLEAPAIGGDAIG